MIVRESSRPLTVMMHASVSIRARLVAASLVLLMAYGAPASAQVREKIVALAPAALVFAMDEKGNKLVAQNADQPFVPASVAKIVTAWLAMEVIGGDYRFKTRFYLDDQRRLYVRGGGDPFLVSEELALLAPKLLAATGKEPFENIVLDAGYYPADLRIPGIESTDEAYDALNSALAVNFNTIHAVRTGNTVRSAEKQTPITPLAISQFKKRGPRGRGRISLAQEDPSIGVRYAGELLAAFIEQAGGKVKKDISTGTVPSGLKPIHVHEQSRDISEILRLMLVGSNNYIANQIFLEVGAQKLGGQVSLEKSLKVANDLLGEKDLSKEIHLVEGSGISRENRFTAQGLAKLLNDFAPHANLLRAARSGSRFKTGTLSDVSTLAGYAKTSKHGLVPFVIALPGRTGKLRFRLLEVIEKNL